MSKILHDFPLFPIGLIVFPGEIQPLHIFEPRYKQLINEMDHHEGYFGIPFVKDGVICEFGSMVAIHKILATSPTGEMDILVRGVSLFKILEIEERLPEKLYGGGKVTLLDELNHRVNKELSQKFINYKSELDKKDMEKLVVSTPNLSFHLLDIAGQLPLQTEEKYNIIKLEIPEQREQFLLKKLDFLLMINQKLEEVGYRFYLN